MENRKKQKESASEKDFLEIVSNYLESGSSGAVVSKVLLATIALGGVVFVGAVAPNLVKVLAKTGKTENVLRTESIGATFSRFKRNGLVYLESRRGMVTIKLTEKGRRYVLGFAGGVRIKKPFIWDRKWRVVVFDIPVKKNREHATFRNRIKKLGFRQIQKSVWVHPFKCEDEVLFLAKELHIENTVEIFTVQKMIHEAKLRKCFNV